jgi:hypothetical protein
MLTLNYDTFTTQYPNYCQPPYDPFTIQTQIEELLLTFPAIETCLPEEVRFLALKHGIEWLNCLDNDESSFYVIDSVKSRNDAIKYKTRSSSGDLASTLHGNRLNRLFKAYGCFHHFSKTSASKCSDSTVVNGCIGGCGQLH